MTNIVMLIGPGRYRLTRQALESLLYHTRSDSFNLTLVLDNAEFRIQSMIDRLLITVGLGLTVLDVRNSGHTLSQLKNIGVEWSAQRFGRGDWLYISDNDVYFTQGWMEKLISTAEFTEPFRYRLFGGQIHPFHKPVSAHPAGVESFNGRWVDNSHPTHPAVFWNEYSVLDGPSWLMRWSTWDLYGPFSRMTAPGVCQSEEYPFCNELIQNEHRIGVIHPHVVIHTGLTHLNGQDCVGRKEREAMIPKGVLAE